MTTQSKSNSALYWVIAVITAAMVVFVYLFISDAPKTLAKIKLSYFTDERELAESITKRLAQEISQKNNYWFGMEPDKTEQIPVLVNLKNLLEEKSKFEKVFVDSELNLSAEQLANFGQVEILALKENLHQFGDVLVELEKLNKSYLVITAAIYTTSVLKENPLHKLKQKHNFKPMTFSFAYFSTTPVDENKFLFKCDTEDETGTKDWACLVVSKSRSMRRKIEANNPKPWLGLMDLTGETDYMFILKKK